MVDAFQSSGNPPSCTITSTLSKVAELFSCSVNDLCTNQTEENMKNVMENFDRVNTVMRVMKLAYPQYSGVQHVMTAPTNADLAAPIYAKNEPNDAMTTTTTNLATINPMVTPPSPLASVEIKTDPNSVNKYRDHSPVASAPRLVSRLPTVTPTVDEQSHSYISPKEFLDKFELTCKKFAAENGFVVSNVWESLLVHALPKDKLAWAEKNILNRNLSWYEARQIYLRAFPLKTASPTPPAPRQQQVQKPQKREKARVTRTLNPLPTPPPTDDDEAKLIRKRQEKYAEYFLALQMREYESIGDYNKKFIRYVNIANIGLSQVDLIRRYLNSLLKEHKEMMDAAFISHPCILKTPENIEEMMKLTEKVITSQQLVKDRIYAQPCWQRQRKRENTDGQQPPASKRSTPFCA